MSHSHLRKEKNCLNCNAIVAERYCQHCGQENTIPKETVAHLVGHFIEDVTHFDGKFFSSMKYLLTRPGYLSKQYVLGKRVSYLNPIRMYLFTSAIVFIILSNVIWNTHYVVPPSVTHLRDSVARSQSSKTGLWEVTTNSFYDSVTKDAYYYMDFAPGVKREGARYYDSVINTHKEKPGFIDDFLGRSIANAGQSYARNPDAFLERFRDNSIHSASQVFFISLPLFAAMLWLLFIRRRKQFYFVTHAIFSLHFYCIAFISFLLIVASFYSDDYGDFLLPAAIIGTTIYLYIAMLRFYKQGWFKTLIKTIIISLYQLVALLVIICYFIIHSFNSAAT